MKKEKKKPTVKKGKSINDIIRLQKKLSSPDQKVLLGIKRTTNKIVKSINEELKKQKINAEAFVGGSYAKNTLVKSDDYDVDVLVRFDWKYDKISPMLKKTLLEVSKKQELKLEAVHGSRDYYKLHPKKELMKGYFEIIPVTKIKSPKEERNVTDLTYFHVPYVKKKLKGLEDEVRISKKFFKAQKVYGAETYVQGFSGYTLELLIIKYKTFKKMLLELSKVKKGERLIIDIEKKFKNKNEIFIELNEAKLHSPVILIDPTYKERNALAALSQETFDKLQERTIKFLKSPSNEYFEKKEVSPEKLKKNAKNKKAEFLSLQITTDKQAGDIAGTKLRKFCAHLEEELEPYYKILGSEFEYYGEQTAKLYLTLKNKKEIIRIGPPVHLKKHARAFKAEHAQTYEENKLLHAKLKLNFTANAWTDLWGKNNKQKIKEMSITQIRIIE